MVVVVAAGSDDGCDISVDYLGGIYERIKEQQFTPLSDHTSQTVMVDRMIQGKKEVGYDDDDDDDDGCDDDDGSGDYDDDDDDDGDDLVMMMVITMMIPGKINYHAVSMSIYR